MSLVNWKTRIVFLRKASKERKITIATQMKEGIEFVEMIVGICVADSQAVFGLNAKSSFSTT